VIVEFPNEEAEGNWNPPIPGTVIVDVKGIFDCNPVVLRFDELAIPDVLVVILKLSCFAGAVGNAFVTFVDTPETLDKFVNNLEANVCWDCNKEPLEAWDCVTAVLPCNVLLAGASLVARPPWDPTVCCGNPVARAGVMRL